MPYGKKKPKRKLPKRGQRAARQQAASGKEMIEIFEKRGRWCFKEAVIKCTSFATEAKRKRAL